MENKILTYQQFATQYLAPDIAKNFIKNCRRAGTLNHKVKNIELAVSTGFVFNDTREGAKSWDKVDKMHREAVKNGNK